MELKKEWKGSSMFNVQLSQGYFCYAALPPLVQFPTVAFDHINMFVKFRFQ